MSEHHTQSEHHTRWIVSPAFDLVWFFGGIFACAAVFGLALGGFSVALMFWAWALLVDAPHLYATISRTYLDREEWRRRGGVLLASLAVLGVGPLFLLVNVATGSEEPFLAFLGLASAFGYLHVIRQHYGFMALYRTQGKEPFSRVDFELDKWCLYVGCWAPYGYFLAVMPVVQSHLELPRLPDPWPELLGGALLVAWALALAVFAWRNLLVLRATASPVKAAYGLLVILLYGGIYMGAARLEPFYAQASTPDEALMVVGIMIALAHGVQYVALVWVHNQRRYAEEGRDFGPARPLSGTLPGYALTCAVYAGTLYLFCAAATGTFPTLRLFEGAGLSGGVTLNQLGLCLWWGIAIHHYVVDMVIWRIKGDDELKRHLGLG